MKFKLDKKIIKYSLYFIATIFLLKILLNLTDSFPSILASAKSFVKYVLHLCRPVIIGLIIAYLLWPLVNFFEKLFKKWRWSNLLMRTDKAKRGASVLITYVLFLAIIVFAVFYLYLMIGGQISSNTSLSRIISYISSHIGESTFTQEYILEQLESLNIPFLGDAIKNNISIIISYIEAFLLSAANNIFSFAIALGSNLFSFFISFFLSIYLLLDREYFLLMWDRAFFVFFRKTKIGRTIRHILATTNKTFSQYIKGQLLEAFFVGVMSIIALYIIRMDYALFIGTISGVTNMIPYLGPWIGTILAATMALLNGNYMTVVYVIIALQIVQQIDNNLVAPRVVGSKVGLHPVFIMSVVIIGGTMNGLLGMLIAVPITAIIKNLLVDWYNSRHIEEKRLAFLEALRAEKQAQEEEEARKHNAQILAIEDQTPEPKLLTTSNESSKKASKKARKTTTISSTPTHLDGATMADTPSFADETDETSSDNSPTNSNSDTSDSLD